MKKHFRSILMSFKPTSRMIYMRYLRKKYLEPKGWMKSRMMQRPVDGDGNPIPWFTYSSLSFLEGRLSKNFAVFEYGSGNSTLWFADHCRHVISVESDPDFYNLIKEQIKAKDNTTYLLETDGSSYANQALNHPKSIDVLIIDGAERNLCAERSVEALKPDGVIIWDNSERAEYAPGYEFLTGQGFKRIDFWGHGPIGSREWCTTVFYRDENCFGI